MSRLWLRAMVLGVACLGLSAAGQGTAAPAKRVGVFVHERSSSVDRIFVYSLNEKSGALGRVKGSPFLASTATELMAVTFDSLSVAYSEPDGMLFSASAKGISAFRVDSRLKLTPVPGSPFGAGHIFSVALARKNNQTFVYGPAYFPDGKGIRGFALQPDGTLVEVPGSPFEPSGGSFTAPVVLGDVLVVLKAGQFVINNGEVVTFRIQADGSLAAGPRFAYDLDAFHPYLARAGAIVFLPEINRRRLVSLLLDPLTGGMTAAAGSPFALNTQLTAGRIALASSGDLTVFFDGVPPDGKLHAQAATVNADGTLTPRGALQALTAPSPTMGVISPKRTCLVTAGAAEVRTFRLSAATGQLRTGRRAALGVSNVDGIAIGVR